MSKSVYAVSSGSYSNYGINAVFSTEEAANAYADRRNRADGATHEYNVEEWELDAVVTIDRTDHIAFRVRLDRPPFWRGNGLNAFGDADAATLPFEDVQVEPFERHFPSRSSHLIYTTWVWAHDRDAALKIGADRIMQEVARREGINASDVETYS